MQILQYLLFLISILILGLSLYLRIDMEFRETFYKHRTLKAGKQAAIKRLIDQVCFLHQQLSFLAFKIKGNYLKLGCSLSKQINAEFQTSLLLYSLIG